MKKFVAIAASLLAAACTTQDASPLIFGQGITVGISVGSSPTNAATPEFVVGVKMADIAIVPTTIPKEIPLEVNGTTKTVESDGTITDSIVPVSRNIRSFGEDTVDKDGKPISGREDALSTFGSFSSQTSTNCVGLGVFFATGVAAQNVSKGFEKSLEKHGVATKC